MARILSGILRILSVLLFFILWFYPANHVIEIKYTNWYDEYYRFIKKQQGFGSIDGIADQFRFPEGQQTSIETYVHRKMRAKPVYVAGEAWTSLLEKARQAAGTGSKSLYKSPETMPPDWNNLETNVFFTPGDYKNTLRIRTYKAYDYGLSDAPPSVRYPFRAHWWQVMLTSLLVFLFAAVFTKGTRTVMQKSTAFTGFAWGAGVVLVGFVGIMSPVVYNMPGMRGGFALFFLGGFVVIAGIITMAVFGFQLKALKRMLSGVGLLAHWTYTPDEWKTFTEEEYREMKGENLQKWLLVTGISLVVGIAFMLIMRDKASVQVFAFLMGFLVFLAFVAWLVPRLGYKRNRREPGEVFIAETGACINGAVHTWNLLDATLDSVELTPDGRLIVFVYSYFTRYGRETATVRIPVPAGQESRALDIVAHFINKQ